MVHNPLITGRMRPLPPTINLPDRQPCIKLAGARHKPSHCEWRRELSLASSPTLCQESIEPVPEATGTSLNGNRPTVDWACFVLETLAPVRSELQQDK